MAFIENAKIVGNSGEFFRETGEPIVIDNYDVLYDAELLGGKAVVHPNDPNRERPVKPFFQFPAPRDPHTCRTDNNDLLNRWILIDDADGLDGFAKAHLVGDQCAVTIESETNAFLLKGKEDRKLAHRAISSSSPQLGPLENLMLGTRSSP